MEGFFTPRLLLKSEIMMGRQLMSTIAYFETVGRSSTHHVGIDSALCLWDEADVEIRLALTRKRIRKRRYVTAFVHVPIAFKLSKNGEKNISSRFSRFVILRRA